MNDSKIGFLFGQRHHLVKQQRTNPQWSYWALRRSIQSWLIPHCEVVGLRNLDGEPQPNEFDLYRTENLGSTAKSGRDQLSHLKRPSLSLYSSTTTTQDSETTTIETTYKVACGGKKEVNGGNKMVLPTITNEFINESFFIETFHNSKLSQFNYVL